MRYQFFSKEPCTHYASYATACYPVCFLAARWYYAMLFILLQLLVMLLEALEIFFVYTIEIVFDYGNNHIQIFVLILD